jgi:hypothetical protein
MQQIVSKCLEKTPEARFQSMEPVAAALRNMERQPDASLASSASTVKRFCRFRVAIQPMISEAE